MDKLVTRLAGVIVGNQIKGDDFVDRLYYYVTSAALLLLATGSGYQLYAGEPIQCWRPNPSGNLRQNGNNEEGINSYCLARKLRRPDSSGSEFNDDSSGHIMDFGTAFFKWAPLIFIFQAFLFKLPNILWKYVSMNSTRDLETIRDLVEEARSLPVEKEKRRKMDEVVTYFETWVTGYKSYSNKYTRTLLAFFFCFGKDSGSFLSSLYICIKLLNLLAVFTCAGLLIGFFDGEFWKYGLSAAHKIYTTGDWEDPNNFPKMLICDFVVVNEKSSSSNLPTFFSSQSSRDDGSLAIEPVQCVMSINFFLEKAFLLEWFWLSILASLTLCNICLWVGKIKQPFSTTFFLKDYLMTIDSLPAAEDGAASPSSGDIDDESLQKNFVDDYLRSDGVFLLRLLEVNSGRSIVGEVVISLWNRYRKIHACKTSLLKQDTKLQTICETVVIDSSTEKNVHIEKALSNIPTLNVEGMFKQASAADNMAFQTHAGKSATNPGTPLDFFEKPEQSLKFLDRLGSDGGRHEKGDSGGLNGGQEEQPDSDGLNGGQHEQPDSDGLNGGQDRQPHSGGLNGGQDQQPHSGGLNEGPHEQLHSGGLNEGQDEQSDSGGLNGGQDKQPDSVGLNGDQDQQPDSGGLNGGQDQQPDSGGLNGGQDQQPDSGGLNGGQDEQPDSGGLNGGQDEQPDSGGLNGGQDQQPDSGGLNGGQEKQPDSGGLNGGQDEQPDSGGLIPTTDVGNILQNEENMSDNVNLSALKMIAGATENDSCI